MKCRTCKGRYGGPDAMFERCPACGRPRVTDPPPAPVPAKPDCVGCVHAIAFCRPDGSNIMQCRVCGRHWSRYVVKAGAA